MARVCGFVTGANSVLALVWARRHVAPARTDLAGEFVSVSCRQCGLLSETCLAISSCEGPENSGGEDGGARQRQRQAEQAGGQLRARALLQEQTETAHANARVHEQVSEAGRQTANLAPRLAVLCLPATRRRASRARHGKSGHATCERTDKMRAGAHGRTWPWTPHMDGHLRRDGRMEPLVTRCQAMVFRFI